MEVADRIAAAPPRRRTRLLRRSVGYELALGLALIAGTTVIPLATGSIYWGQVFLLGDIYVIGAVSLNVLRGEAGQISFGQGAIFGVAAYATAMSAGVYGVRIAWAMAIGVGFALAFGVLLSLPALRVQGYYLAFVTLGAALVFPDLLGAYNNFTRATTGISVPVPGIGKTLFLGMDWIALTILCFTLAALVAYAFIHSSRLGRQMRVSAASPEAALSLGISPAQMRIAAFAISAVGTGVAGALYVPLFGFVSPGAFPLSLSILLYFAVVVGGEGTLIGPIAGIYLLYILPNNVLTGLVEYRLLVYGSIAFCVMFFLPDGLIGTIRESARRLRGHRAEATVNIEGLVKARRAPERSAGQGPAKPVLRIHGATKSFGAVRALDDVSLEVAPGEIHGLVGPNGSGKTTLLNALSGFVRLESGEVAIEGVAKLSRSARSRARHGIGRTFQTPRVFENMSVWENVDLKRVVAEQGDLVSNEALAAVRSRWDEAPAGTLPHAQRRLLEVVRVLRSNPRIVLLDEPAAGLSAEERLEFASILKTLARDAGLAVILVEHDLTLVWQIADRITIMEEGRVLVSGTPQELEGNDALDAVLVSGGRRADAD